MSLETEKIERDLDESRHRLNDTINQLGRKLSPGQILDEALGLLQGQAGHFASNLGRQVRDNPIPTLLVAAGVIMLATSKRGGNSHHMSSADQEHYRSIEEARAGTQRIPGETDEAYEERTHLAFARALNLEQGPQEQPTEFRRRVADAVHAIERTVAGAGRRVSGAVRGAASGAKQAVSGATRAVRVSPGKVGDAVSDVRDRAGHFYETNPLAMGALMFGVGAIIGGATPLTQVERSGLQGLADTAAREGAKAAERGADAVEKAVH